MWSRQQSLVCQVYQVDSFEMGGHFLDFRGKIRETMISWGEFFTTILKGFLRLSR